MQRPPRRRRTPDEAAQEILSAAEELFSERSYHEVTVAAIMERTTLSRKSFYVYFADIPDLLRRLVEPIQKESTALLVRSTQEPATFIPTAFHSLAQLYIRHGPMLRALYEAGSHDAQARQVWLDYIEPSVRIVTAGIEAGIEAGMITNIDPEPTARALVGMNSRIYFEQLAGRPDADVDGVVALLLRIWARVLHRADAEELGWLSSAPADAASRGQPSSGTSPQG